MEKKKAKLNLKSVQKKKTIVFFMFLKDEYLKKKIKIDALLDNKIQKEEINCNYEIYNLKDYSVEEPNQPLILAYFESDKKFQTYSIHFHVNSTIYQKKNRIY